MKKHSQLFIFLLAALADHVVLFWLKKFRPEMLVERERFLVWLPIPVAWGVAGLAVLIFFRFERYRLASLLMAGGLVSNVLAHFRFGHFVDYLPWMVWYTNLADLIIWVGILMALVTFFRYQKTGPEGPVA